MLIKSDKYDKIVNDIVYVSFFVHQFAFLFGASDLARNHEPYHYISVMMKIIPFVIMCMSIVYYFLKGKFSLKEINIYIVIAIPLLISLYNYRSVMVISNLFYVAIFKNVDAKKSMEIALWATIIGFVLNVILGLTTIYTGDCIQIRYGVPRIRHGLGFHFAYVTSYFYMTIILIYILAIDNISILQYAILMICNVIVFIFTDTKAPFVYGTLTLLLHIIFTKTNIKIFDKLFDVLVVIAYPAATFLSIVLPYLYVNGNKYWAMLNKIVNGRLYLTKNAFLDCGWRLFGQNAIIFDRGIKHIDSAMASMFVQNGLVILILSVAFMTFFSYMAVKIKHKPLMIVLSVMALRGIFDMGFMAMQLGPVIILFYDVMRKYFQEEEL